MTRQAALSNKRKTVCFDEQTIINNANVAQQINKKTQKNKFFLFILANKQKNVTACYGQSDICNYKQFSSGE